MERATFDTQDARAAASPLPGRATRTAAQSSEPLDGRARLHRLAQATHRLIRTEGFLASGGGMVSAELAASLRPIVAEIACEWADPPDRIRAGEHFARRYLAALGRLIRACAAAEPLLDDETLAQLDWFTQRIRLEYLHVRLAARLDEWSCAAPGSRTRAMPGL